MRISAAVPRTTGISWPQSGQPVRNVRSKSIVGSTQTIRLLYTLKPLSLNAIQNLLHRVVPRNVFGDPLGPDNRKHNHRKRNADGRNESPPLRGHGRVLSGTRRFASIRRCFACCLTGHTHSAQSICTCMTTWAKPVVITGTRS